MQTLAELAPTISPSEHGAAMHAFATELYPICRSITGPGLRATLRAVGQRVPLMIHEVASGTPVLDWQVPNEWTIRDAYIAADGVRLVDFQRHNLHVLNYSAPVRATLALDALRPHLFTDPKHPNQIPYRTSYYRETWGFCLSQQQLDALPDRVYEVVVDSDLAPGSLSYGELVLPGTSDREVLISTHCCHPSLANDNLSGIAVATALAALLQGVEHRYTYRFVFVPGTIGSITWLAHQTGLERIIGGLVLTCVGDPGDPTYKRSRRGDTPIDAALETALARRGPHTVQPFSPYGYDERQYCSPGFDLPVGCLMRSPHGSFPQYHTSADDLALITPAALADTLALVIEAITLLERDERYVNLSPRGEPQLGRRGLYGSLGGSMDPQSFQLALLWVLNQSDGQHGLLGIAQRSGLPLAVIEAAARALLAADLLRPADE